ncbi:gag-pol polyprotein, partial [Tanacetum coccineum]
MLVMIHTTSSLRTVFRRHKVRVVNDGPMEKMLKISDAEGQLVKWAAELRMYDVSYVPRKVIRAVKERPGSFRKRAATLSAWRLYLKRKAKKEGPGVGMILVSPDKKASSYVIRLNFYAPEESIDYEALLVGLVASTGKGMKDLHVFVESRVLVDQMEGSRVPRTREEKKYKEEVMNATALF